MHALMQTIKKTSVCRFIHTDRSLFCYYHLIELLWYISYFALTFFTAEALDSISPSASFLTTDTTL